jgi:predicted Zn-ribbon and HTH transcriptional regulator
MGLIFRNKGEGTPMTPEDPAPTDEELEAGYEALRESEEETLRRLSENTDSLHQAITELPKYSRDSACRLCGYDRATTESKLVTWWNNRLTSIKAIWRMKDDTPHFIKVLSRRCPNCDDSWYEKPITWEGPASE